MFSHRLFVSDFLCKTPSPRVLANGLFVQGEEFLGKIDFTCNAAFSVKLIKGAMLAKLINELLVQALHCKF